MTNSKIIKSSGNNSISFGEYFYANLFFWGLLVVVAVISYFTCGAVWDDVTSGTMEFIFVIMGGGFTFVSVLDYLYEIKIAASAKEIAKTH
jgi:zinc transporter ZupT